MKRRSELLLAMLLLPAILAGSLGDVGCAKRGARPSSVPEFSPIDALRLMREDLSDATQQKLHIKLVVPATASNAQIADLVQRVAAAEELESGILWLSVFLEGMDLNSVAYAFGVARPGDSAIPLSYRQSLQTYR